MKNEKHVALAQKICREWKAFWMNQKQNSEQDYKNYFRRAMGVDANMRVHLEGMIAKSLAETESEALASKVEFPRDEVVIDAVHADAKKCCESCYYKSLNAEVTMLHTIKKFRDNLTLAPNEQVIRVPKRKTNTCGLDGEARLPWQWDAQGFNEAIEEIKRLNANARIEESNE